MSDVVCPWCVIGLRGLEIALERTGIAAEVRLHPFELNPSMPREGQDMAEHIAEKYGASPEQSAASRQVLRERAAAVAFEMRANPRIYSSFDAHRLLDWASGTGRQLDLQHALFRAYFTLEQDISDAGVLIEATAEAGLDRREARAILASDAHADPVREQERRWRGEGVTAVPTIVISDRYVISGGQPPEAFAKALTRIVAERIGVPG